MGTTKDVDHWDDIPGGDPEKEKSDRENHQPVASFEKFIKTTSANIGKSGANTSKPLVFLLIGIGVTLLLGNVFPNIFPMRQKGNNEGVIEYLEKERKSFDSVITAQNNQLQKFLQQAADRERRDSLTNLVAQTQLLQTINQIKPLYDKIPSYADVSKDSLRRLFADRYGMPAR